MHKLVHGALTFHRQYFVANRDLFQRLATDGQQPQALYIGCSDSRVVPNLITMSGPGDLFIVRNIGNLVPPPGETADASVASAIEYALLTLGIRDVILCGHTRCGAMRALLQDGPLPSQVARWLAHGRSSRTLLDTYYPEVTGDEERLERLCQVNVLVQLDHLKAHPVVAERLAAGTVHLHAWLFDVHTGHLSVYQPDEEKFVPLDESASAGAAIDDSRAMAERAERRAG